MTQITYLGLHCAVFLQGLRDLAGSWQFLQAREHRFLHCAMGLWLGVGAGTT